LALNQIDDGDLLLYIDAGSYINKYAKNVFDDYINIVNKNAGFLALNCDNSIEKKWTKRDLFKLLDCDEPYYTNSNQIAAGLVIYKKNDLTIKFLKEFQKISLIEHAINDYNSYNPNYDEFIEHRHDQSVFGLLVKKIYKNEDIALIDFNPNYADEVKFVRNWINDKNTKGIMDLTYPLLHTRIDDITFNLK
jgi:hypothetical protein